MKVVVEVFVCSEYIFVRIIYICDGCVNVLVIKKVESKTI